MLQRFDRLINILSKMVKIRKIHYVKIVSLRTSSKFKKTIM